ncbi:LysR family transcriptional regulator [Agrobacterium tumefaciens]|uniref:LysR family transcriptional regulator n=1 Tax=Agrobacterium tumefaciens TaxID=358 RepID=UPI00129AB67C|nr:LysR substrate-binding domain-containing protein [Agrobacterium tumefaciens]MRH98198.1 LysR family transcriptional regulator [Agrobacterium tumefaciens]
MEANFDIRLLRMFIEVAETGVVSKAAGRLARTQAAVSMQLQRIEQDLDAQLLVRSSRGVSLTDAGSSFLAYARKTVALTEDMHRGLTDRRLAGRVRIGLFEDLAFTRLPAALADFRRKHPHVKIELTSSYSKELARSLKEGHADLVIADPARFTEPPTSFISRRLVWCASRLIDLDEGGSLPIILFDTQCSWQDRMLSDLAENNIGWHVGCKVKTLPAMLSALRAGLGLGLLFPEAVPLDCELIDGQHGLPNAPAAEFGVFFGADASQHVQELALFLRQDY